MSLVLTQLSIGFSSFVTESVKKRQNWNGKFDVIVTTILRNVIKNKKRKKDILKKSSDDNFFYLLCDWIRINFFLLLLHFLMGKQSHETSWLCYLEKETHLPLTMSFCCRFEKLFCCDNDHSKSAIWSKNYCSMKTANCVLPHCGRRLTQVRKN